jgi:Ala-tRNA(Pro) deacylase
MTTTPEALFARLDELKIAHRTVAHAAVYTVDEAKAHRGALSGGHTKNLFLKDKKDRLYLAVTLEDSAVDLKALAPLIGADRLSFASPELLLKHLGVEPGSVTPFSLINDRGASVKPVFDQTMFDFADLNFHPLVNTATTAISSADLLRFARGCGHEPLILRFPRRPSAGIS